MIHGAVCRIQTLMLLLVVCLLMLAGCVSVPPSLPEPTATAGRLETTSAPEEPTTTATSVPQGAGAAPSPEASVAAHVVPEGLQTPVPIIYKMFDYGTDYQHLAPELGPIGSIMWFDWQRINPGRGEYNWSIIDSKLALEENLKVTLPDGTEIPKPVVIQIMASISGSAGSYSFTDYTPGWVYDIINAENPGNPRPVVGGRTVGHKLEGCSTVAVIPMYESPTWRKYHYDMIRAFGERYNDHPQVTAVVVNTGLDGETQPVKDISCPWNTYLDQQASGVRYNFTRFMQELLPVYRQAFPTKTLYINNAPGGSGTRKMTSDLAASIDPPIGLKHSGMWVDLDSHQGYGDFYGSWDMIKAYSMTLPIWLESPFGLGSAEHRYWSIIAGLHYHPDAIDVHPEYLTQSDPEWFGFAVKHLGVSIQDTPDVWTVLRDAEYPLVTWGDDGVSGHMGDWTFWLNRRDSAPQSQTKVLLREAMPAARDHVYSRQARSTMQDSNSPFMSFDIDDAYPYVNMKPVAVEGGSAYFKIRVTILNRGTDTFALEYRNWQGDMITERRTKGPGLGAVNDWVEVTFTVEDAYLANNMPGNVDFRISSERDGDEIIHMVLVEGGWGVPPPPTPTAPPTVTPLASATARATSTPPPTPSGSTPAIPSESDAASTPTPMPGAVRFDPSADTYLDQWVPKAAHYQERDLAARQGDIRAPLVLFDLSQIAPSSIVEQAVLQLKVRDRTNLGYLKLSAHKVFRDWEPDSTSWQSASTNVKWAVPGCNDPVQDRSAVFVSDVWLTATNQWVTLDLTSLVQEWVANPEQNRGVILKASGSTSVEYDLYSSDHTDVESHPRLMVVWRELTPTPAPTSDVPTPAPGDLQQIVVQEGQGDAHVDDSTLDSWAPDINFVSQEILLTYQGSAQVPVLRFDLAQIPTGVSIKSATLHLYSTARSMPAPLSLSVARINKNWQPEAVTWRRTSASEAWFQPGAREVGGDRSARLYDTGVVGDANQWVTWQITDLVQEWVMQPELNHGLILLSDGADAVQYTLASSEWPMLAQRPYLEVSYVLATPTATPPGSPTAAPYPTSMVTSTPAASEPTATPDIYRWVLQQGLGGYGGATDTTIDSRHQTMSLGQQATLSLAQPSLSAALLRFALPQAPEGLVMREAELALEIVNPSAGSDVTLAVYRLLRPWDEQVANWIQAEQGLPWDAAGAAGQGDRLSEPLVQASLAAGQSSISLDVSEAVKVWLQDPQANHGLVIVADGAEPLEIGIASAQWQFLASRPMLEVVFAEGEPWTESLDLIKWLAIGLGIVLLLWALRAGGRSQQAKQKQVR